MVRPWIKRLALWGGPTLLMILAWQVWDRREERLLAEALESRWFAAPAADVTPATDSAARFYAAASALIEQPLTPSTPRLLSELRGLLATGATPSEKTRAALTDFSRRHATVFPLIDTAADLPMGEMKAPSGDSLRYVDDAYALATMERLLAGETDLAAATVVSRLRALRVFKGRLHMGTLHAESEKAIAITSDLALALGGSQLSPTRDAAIDAALAGAFAPDELQAAFRGQARGATLLGADKWGPEATWSSMGTGLPLRPVWRETARGSVRALATCLEVATRPWPDRFVEMQKLSEPPPGYVARQWLGLQFPGSTVYGCQDVTELFGRAVAMIRVSRVALAVERYRARAGRLPDALSALDIDTRAGDYLDPFTGKPLLYRRDAAQFAVYSVGSNFRDDGGKATRQMFIGEVFAGDNPGSPDVGVAVRLATRAGAQ